eukprot:7382340-Prymnesium_polylepis.1
MRALLRWLSLDDVEAPARRARVDATATAKYEVAYCDSELRSAEQRRAHCALGLALQPVLEPLALGYDVLHGSAVAFGCLGRLLRVGAPDAACASATPDPALARALQELHGGLLWHLQRNGSKGPSVREYGGLGGERLMCAATEL